MHDSTDTHETRPSLLLRVRDLGDSQAWSEFVDLYGPLVARYLRRAGLQEADILDLTQDILLGLTASLRAFEYSPERGRFRDWMGTVVRRRLQDFFRRRCAQGRVVEDASLELLGGAAAEAEWTSQFQDHILRSALTRIRDRFSSENWRAFELNWLENLDAPEVARQLGLPLEQVYVARSRVLRRLRLEIVALAADEPLGLDQAPGGAP